MSYLVLRPFHYRTPDGLVTARPSETVSLTPAQSKSALRRGFVEEVKGKG